MTSVTSRSMPLPNSGGGKSAASYCWLLILLAYALVHSCEAVGEINIVSIVGVDEIYLVSRQWLSINWKPYTKFRVYTCREGVADCPHFNADRGPNALTKSKLDLRPGLWNVTVVPLKNGKEQLDEGRSMKYLAGEVCDKACIAKKGKTPILPLTVAPNGDTVNIKIKVIGLCEDQVHCTHFDVQSGLCDEHSIISTYFNVDYYQTGLTKRSGTLSVVREIRTDYLELTQFNYYSDVAVVLTAQCTAPDGKKYSVTKIGEVSTGKPQPPSPIENYSKFLRVESVGQREIDLFISTPEFGPATEIVYGVAVAGNLTFVARNYPVTNYKFNMVGSRLMLTVHVHEARNKARQAAEGFYVFTSLEKFCDEVCMKSLEEGQPPAETWVFGENPVYLSMPLADAAPNADTVDILIPTGDYICIAKYGDVFPEHASEELTVDYYDDTGRMGFVKAHLKNYRLSFYPVPAFKRKTTVYFRGSIACEGVDADNDNWHRSVNFYGVVKT